MAKIVELVGSPGVGKTTLYRQIEGVWNKGYNWMPAQQFYPRKEVIAEKSDSYFLDFFQWIKTRNGKVDTSAMEEAGRRFVELFPEYIEACWNNINCAQKKNINKSDLRFQKVSYLYHLIKKIQTIRENSSEKVAIVDEGLIHIINSVLYKKEVLTEEKEEINRFLEIMPIPDGIVSIETSIHENMKRLSERKKVIPMHKSLTNAELENIIRLDHGKRAVINTILKNKNIPFLEIDSTDAVAGNVAKIIAFAKEI